MFSLANRIKRIPTQWTIVGIFLLISIAACSQHKNSVVATRADTVIYYPTRAAAYISLEDSTRINRGAEEFFNSKLRNTGFNGGMIVAKSGRILFERYNGTENLNGKQPVDSNTSLHIASTSKTFTAMAVLKLQEAGKLNIDDPLTKYFPGWNYPGVTIKTLLDHRSGLPNYLYFMQEAGWNTSVMIKNADILQWLITKKTGLKNVYAANRRFEYSNTNFALLALIIEKVSGMPFPQFIQQLIFRPLDMQHTYVHYPGDGRTVTGSFDWRGRAIPDNFLDGVYGDKNVYSTPRDLLKWDRALSDTVFLSAASLEAAYTPYSNEHAGEKNYGLGWRMNIYPGDKKLIYHNGWWHGNNSGFVRAIRNDATIIMLSNRYDKNVYKAKLLANLFEFYFKSDADEDESAPADTSTPVKSVRKKRTVSHRTRIPRRR